MTPEPFLTELAVSDFPAALGWYRDRLGLPVTLLDEPNQFALLADRLALKAGTPSPGGVTVHFRVDDLDAELARLSAAGVVPDGPVKASPEGYRRAFVRDPDGYRVGLFAWTADRPGASK